MNEQTLPHYVGLDLGTTMVRCIVGVPDHDDPSKLAIMGYGVVPNTGMRKGVVVYVDEVAEAVANAVSEAERMSGVHINSATVNINGTHVMGMDSKGVIAISTANREITENDRYRVEEAATIVSIPPNREIVQVFAKNYRLDGQTNIKDPVGMQGVRLEVDAHIVTASVPNIRNLDAVLEKARVVSNRHTVSSLAAAEAVLERQQKESGTVLLDIGAGTTNLVVIEDGEIQHIAVLPIGGMHITNDLAIGLKTDLDIAEKVKLKHAGMSAKHKQSGISVEHNKQVHTFQNSEISMIVEARVDELMDYVDKELKKIRRSRKLPGGVVLTGGAVKLPGIVDFTRDKLELATRIGKLQNISGLVEKVSNDPSSYTAVGLMMLDMLLQPMGHSQSKAKPSTKLLNSISGVWHSWRR